MGTKGYKLRIKDTISDKLGIETADCVTELVSNLHVSSVPLNVPVPPTAMEVCALLMDQL